VTLELGGKSPAIVFEDADIETAIKWSIIGITKITGQVCAASSRIYIHESIMDSFLQRLKTEFELIAKNLGEDPQNPKSDYGPVIDKGQYDKVWSYIQGGKQDSASVLTGGEEYTKPGHYIAPTIFVNPKDDAKVYREEVFGPVLCAKSFKTEEEVLKLANDTTFGLAGAVFTQDINRALRISSKIQAGSIGINCATMIGPQVPFGGLKQSGLGRELGEYALRHYTEPKTIWINMNR
jgi:aldehyde dehydrogenase (NAD+)